MKVKQEEGLQTEPEQREGETSRYFSAKCELTMRVTQEQGLQTEPE